MRERERERRMWRGEERGGEKGELRGNSGKRGKNALLEGVEKLNSCAVLR